MRPFTIALLLAAFTLSACGQKGPLVLPENTAPPPEQAVESTEP